MKTTELPCGACIVRRRFLNAQQEALYYLDANSREDVRVETKPAAADKKVLRKHNLSPIKEERQTPRFSETAAGSNSCYPSPRIMQAARQALANYKKGLV